MNIEELKCIDENNNIDEYLKFYDLVKSQMLDKSWLGSFEKDEIINIISNGGKLFEYYENDVIVCSMLYIPTKNASLQKHGVTYDESLVGSCGPIMVNPNYWGKGLQWQMLKLLDKYCTEIGKEYILTKVHPHNKYSVTNFIQNGYEYVETYNSNYGGIRNVYIKKLKQ